MKINVCDRCGTDLNKVKFTFFNIEEVPYYCIARGHRGKYDLCMECNSKLTELFSKFLNELREDKEQ